MEDAQESKREGRGETRKENKDENSSKKTRMDFKDKKPAWQRVNMVYTPLTVPITQALMAVEGKGLLSRPRTYRDEPRQPKSDKFCRFHNDYGHTIEECRHLKSEIERLIQNRYLQETSMMGRTEVNDPPRKGIIRMIIDGPAGGDSQRARKARVREAYGIKMKEIMDVEPIDDTPLIQFDQEEHSGPRIPGNDTLVITALLANYEIERVFIDSVSSADILFGEAYDQMQLGDAPLEAVDTSLYGFAGESNHIYVSHENKVSVVGGVGEAQANILRACKCYVEAIKRGKKRILEELSGEENSNKRGKDSMPRTELKEEAPITVQPVEENSLLSSSYQGEVNKLLTAEHIREIQFPEWLSNVVLVPKPVGKWRLCIDFRDLNKVCPKNYYLLPRIDQLVDSTSGCELLRMMDTSQGYHQIMLAPEDHKRVSFITSDGTFCYVAMPFGLKTQEPPIKDWWIKYSDHN
ncbi:UNVERIFIED_CONTAM: hypothetical protein Slati_0470100 [Sesamum latifolium]|uniref:Reverse transcriptase domain-containing protein n=1 Tax=Sesamum latifolium TaxID=2727402 RepID=A0AAW2XZ46_9LAMI